LFHVYDRGISFCRSVRVPDAGLAKLQELPNLRVLDVRYSGITAAGVDAFLKVRPGCKVIFVSNTAPVSRLSGSDRPKSASAKAVASWLESLGGQVRISEGRITAVSLRRVPFTDAQLVYLKNLTALEQNAILLWTMQSAEIISAMT